MIHLTHYPLCAHSQLTPPLCVLLNVQGPYRLSFTYNVDSVVALVASQEFDSQLRTTVITVVYEGVVYTANPGAATTTTIAPTVQEGDFPRQPHTLPRIHSLA